MSHYQSEREKERRETAIDKEWAEYYQAYKKTIRQKPEERIRYEPLREKRN